MATMAGFKVWQYKKSLPETVMSLQIIPPSMMVKSDITALLRFIVMTKPIILVITFELCHQQKNHNQLLNSLMIWQLQTMLQLQQPLPP